MLNGKTLLVTGGTGSFGKKFIARILSDYDLHKVIVYSRDEFKQYQMKIQFSERRDKLRFFLGDIRDRGRLSRAFDGVDYVVHAAALKQVPALEYNPTEAVKTNVIGADNIVDAAIERGVQKVVALSTDKAVNPVNLYGATKLCAEKIFTAANAYGGGRVVFSSVRYGNVMGSRGSVIPLFMKMAKEGVKEFPITDERMTRFWITLGQGVDLVITALEESAGGETFIPKIPSMKITDLAEAICPGCKYRVIGIRAGEKLHETLISIEEARNVKVFDEVYVILPEFQDSQKARAKFKEYPSVDEKFSYRSDNNEEWLTAEQLKSSIERMTFE